jgi:8-oxo-dGTP diphosphatase
MKTSGPQLGVGAVILDDSHRVLLMLRRKPPEAGNWSLAGGRVEFMEPIEAAVVREVKEELGVDVEIRELLCVTNHILPDEKVHWVAPAFLVRVIDGEITNREPLATWDVQFFPLDAVPLNLTATARNALGAYRKKYPSPCLPLPAMPPEKEIHNDERYRILPATDRLPDGRNDRDAVPAGRTGPDSRHGIVPDARGKRIGEKLLEFVEQFAADQGLDRITSALHLFSVAQFVCMKSLGSNALKANPSICTELRCFRCIRIC